MKVSIWVGGLLVGSLLVAVAGIVGCYNSKLNQTENKLKACGDRNTQLSSTARDLDVCRHENAEFKEWKEQIVADLMRTASPDIKNERAIQIEEVSGLPKEIRIEVGKRVDHFFIVMMKEFNEEKRRHAELLSALGRTHRQTEKTQETVEQMAAGTSEIHQDLAALKHQEEEESTRLERQKRLSEEIHQVVEAIAGFDRRINCRSCRDSIGMIKARTETLKFHSELLKDLSSLQQSLELR